MTRKNTDRIELENLSIIERAQMAGKQLEAVFIRENLYYKRSISLCVTKIFQEQPESRITTKARSHKKNGERTTTNLTNETNQSQDARIWAA